MLHMCRPGVLQTTDDNDRCQRAPLVWPRYTMCRRASNKQQTLHACKDNGATTLPGMKQQSPRSIYRE